MSESTADIGAVSRTNKYGQSMPILKPVAGTYPKIQEYRVEHEGKHVGNISKWPGGWLAYPPEGQYTTEIPFQHRHHAVGSLFGLEPRLSNVAKQEGYL